MNYLSICSGIEAATVAWQPLGWHAVGYSEIEPFPCAVLAHHYPGVPNFGDATRFQDWPDAAVDVLVGGTPCQSFSIAGLRKGLADPRGNLMLTFGAIAQRFRPRWLVWENVPGVLSSDDGRDFGAFLRLLAELGYGFAYRVLDAQYFGVPQRRRRVLLVGYLGDWRRAAAVLFESASLRGDPAPRRQARQDVAGGPGAGLAFGGGRSSGPLDVATTLTASASGRLDFTRETYILPFDTTQICSPTNRSHPRSGDPCPPLCANGHAPAIAFDCKASGQHGFGVGEVASTLRSMGHGQSHSNGGGHQAVMAGQRVRRLTPRECERLQCFPDDYTLIPLPTKDSKRNRWAKDGPRYNALGNSMAVPVMAWLGRRIALVDALPATIEAAA